MRRARDVREQIEGLMTRVEIEMVSNATEDVSIRKVYTYINIVTTFMHHAHNNIGFVLSIESCNYWKS